MTVYSFVRTEINSSRDLAVMAPIFQKYTIPYVAVAKANSRERRAQVRMIALFLTSLSIIKIIIALGV